MADTLKSIEEWLSNSYYSNLTVFKMSPTAKLPTKGTPDSAGLDFYLDLGGEGNEITIGKDEYKRIPTGIAVSIPEGFCGLMHERSSAFKMGLVIRGLIDSDFRDNLSICIRNTTAWPISLKHGMSYGQMILLNYSQYIPLKEVDSFDKLPKPKQEHLGFGSTKNTNLV